MTRRREWRQSRPQVWRNRDGMWVVRAPHGWWYEAFESHADAMQFAHKIASCMWEPMPGVKAEVLP